jgi:hypothetical protein
LKGIDLNLCNCCGFPEEHLVTIQDWNDRTQNFTPYKQCITCIRLSRIRIVEKHKIDIPVELYTKWLNDELVKLNEMDIEAIEARIIQLQTETFEKKTQLGAAFKVRLEKLGQDFKAGRDSLITEPNFQVLFQSDPRTKTTTRSSEPRIVKPKLTAQQKTKKLLDDSGIDLIALRAKMAELKKEKK